jgi:RNA polymerase sigma-70 factor (ECF subfamily)
MVVGGGGEEFESAFERLYPRAFRVAYRVLGNETSAEDAAAEALARAHASWSKIGDRPYRDAWVLRVTANVAIDMFRKDRRVLVSDDPWSRTRQHVDDEREAAVLRLALVAALSALSRRQREVIALHYLEGFSEAEIATCLRISPGTVKKTTSRAKEALRRSLGDDWDHTVRFA